MGPLRILFAGMILLVAGHPVRAGFLARALGGDELAKANCKLQGRVLDFTANHGSDQRVFCEALGVKRDLYVYVPPGYDPKLRYPVAFFLHGIANDEQSFFKFVDLFDQGIVCGRMPPTIIAAPDGSVKGRPVRVSAGSFFVNSKAGCFEDYLMKDMWEFVHRTFRIRPEREAHALVGGSMGGFAAYNLGIKYRDRVGVVAAVFPPLNLRYVDCHGRYFAKFDPNCFAWRTEIQPWSPVGRYYGVIVIRQRRLISPLYGNPRRALDDIRRENPAEMLDDYGVKPGELEMFVAYVGKDEFNMGAQIDSFLYLARSKGLTVTSVFLPNGHHTNTSARKLIPSLIDWLGPRLSSYGPIGDPPAAQVQPVR